MNTKNYILKQKNFDVAVLEIEDDTGHILDIKEIINDERIPVMAKFSNQGLKFGLKYWFKHRSIPSTRTNIDQILNENNVLTTSGLSLKQSGLNLTDQYWFCPINQDILWEHVNLFKNNFEKMNFKSKHNPDSSSNGELDKYWDIINDKRILYKIGSLPYYQQPCNELISSLLLDEFKIPHVQYSCEVKENNLYSKCETFITSDTEYIPALHLLGVCKKRGNISNYQHFINCTESLNIPNVKENLDNMLAFDFIINNNDRHYGNFGFIRDVESLKYISMAPLFDNGNSLWYNIPTEHINLRNDTSKPFKEHHINQIKHASNITANFSITVQRLSSIFEQAFQYNNLISTERCIRIKDNVYKALGYINEISKNQGHQVPKTFPVR